MNTYAYKTAGNTFAIFELKDHREVFESTDGKEVKEKTRFLNNGGGFAGDTPQFFQKVVAKAV